MLKIISTLLISSFLLLACSGKKKEADLASKVTDEEKVAAVYAEAVEYLNKGDAFYAAKKFRETESLMPQTEWAAKSALMAAYADYSRNAYTKSIFGLERFIKTYPADKNISYAHYLIAMSHYEQILDEKKDLEPLLKARKKFKFIFCFK